MSLASWAKRFSTGKRAFAILVSKEGGLSFRILQEQDSRLVDVARATIYTIDRASVPTNWRGRFNRAYLIREHEKQPAEPGSAGTSGQTSIVPVPAEIAEPAHATGGSSRGTMADAIFDRALSAQMRRLGNRRFNRAQAALMITAGLFITSLILAGATIMTHKPAATTSHALIAVPEGTPMPTLAPSDPVIVVQPLQTIPIRDADRTPPRNYDGGDP